MPRFFLVDWRSSSRKTSARATSRSKILRPFVRFDVKADGPLVPVRELEHGALPIRHGDVEEAQFGPVAFRISGHVLDFQHVRPKVPQYGTGPGTGVKHAVFKDKNAVKGWSWISVALYGFPITVLRSLSINGWPEAMPGKSGARMCHTSRQEARGLISG